MFPDTGYFDFNFFQVYNVLPSISAITGVSPQRYLWRVSIALHIGPRLLIASVYYSFYFKILKTIEDLPTRLQGSRLLNLCYWLNISEVAALCGVTYISNRENYGESLINDKDLNGDVDDALIKTN